MKQSLCDIRVILLVARYPALPASSCHLRQSLMHSAPCFCPHSHCALHVATSCSLVLFFLLTVPRVFPRPLKSVWQCFPPSFSGSWLSPTALIKLWLKDLHLGRWLLISLPSLEPHVANFESIGLCVSQAYASHFFFKKPSRRL